jgi:hypothetical protein
LWLQKHSRMTEDDAHQMFPAGSTYFEGSWLEPTCSEGRKARAETDSFVYKQEKGAHLLSHLIVCKVNLSQRTTRTGRKATSNHTFAVSAAENRRVIKLMAHYMHALVGVKEDSEVAEEEDEECGEAELDD